jgi:hypothetical protein
MLEFVSVSGRLLVLESYHRLHRLEGVVQSYSHKIEMLSSPLLSRRHRTTASCFVYRQGKAAGEV